MGEPHRVTSADGTPIAYRVSGAGDAVVFVHGACTSGADWLPVERLLRDRFRVVIMDRRGRGASGDAEAYAIEREAEDVAAVLAASGARFLVAHSYGALCSLIAVEHGAKPERLVLYEPPIALGAEFATPIQECVEAGDRDGAVAAFLRSAGTTSEQLEATRASRAWPVLLDAVGALPRELLAGAAWRPPAEPIDVPTLSLVGGETTAPIYLAGRDALHAAFTDLAEDVLPGQQHVGHVFAAPAFAERVAAFLT